ncbi:MAG: glycosyltransferase [Bryobacteraceae bacterium]
MPRLDFVFFDAGGGHRSAATALKSVVEQQQRPWQIRLVNLQEVLDSLDVFRKITGIRLEDIYNKMLAKGWTFGSAQGLRFMQSVIRSFHKEQVDLLTGFWSQDPPDMVVSLVPNFNRAMYQGLHRADRRIPYVTILTDLADYPPHFWIERRQPGKPAEPVQSQYFICGTDRAAEQALAFGHPQNRVFKTSGMILRPMFYDPVRISIDKEREQLGLAPNVPTGIVLFGGQGSKAMLRIAERLGRSGLRHQLIMICGKNEPLAIKLRALKLPIKMHVEGFTSEIPRFMRLADFFIGKPGPGSISEAIKMGLPVIIERNYMTLPQERYNADWVRSHGVGIVVESFKEIERAVREMLEPGTLGRFQTSAASIDNRAAFEIPEILEEILASQPR